MKNPLEKQIELPRRFIVIPKQLIVHSIAEAEKSVGANASHNTLRKAAIKILDRLLRNVRKNPDFKPIIHSAPKGEDPMFHFGPGFFTIYGCDIKALEPGNDSKINEVRKWTVIRNGQEVFPGILFGNLKTAEKWVREREKNL